MNRVGRRGGRGAERPPPGVNSRGPQRSAARELEQPSRARSAGASASALAAGASHHDDGPTSAALSRSLMQSVSEMESMVQMLCGSSISISDEHGGDDAQSPLLRSRSSTTTTTAITETMQLSPDSLTALSSPPRAPMRIPPPPPPLRTISEHSRKSSSSSSGAYHVSPRDSNFCISPRSQRSQSPSYVVRAEEEEEEEEEEERDHSRVPPAWAFHPTVLPPTGTGGSIVLSPTKGEDKEDEAEDQEEGHQRTENDLARINSMLDSLFAVEAPLQLTQPQPQPPQSRLAAKTEPKAPWAGGLDVQAADAAAAKEAGIFFNFLAEARKQAIEEDDTAWVARTVEAQVSGEVQLAIDRAIANALGEEVQSQRNQPLDQPPRFAERAAIHNASGGSETSVPSFLMMTREGKRKSEITPPSHPPPPARPPPLSWRLAPNQPPSSAFLPSRDPPRFAPPPPPAAVARRVHVNRAGSVFVGGGRRSGTEVFSS